MNLKFFSDPGDAENFEPFPIMFSRGSVAYDGNLAPLASNQPGFIGGEKGVYGLGVYESYTNILTSSLSQDFNTEWTSGTLNGTYTINIRSGGGSITLSGGATGTVTSGNSLTFTVTSNTVTFTPTGSCLNTIIINKPYPLPWILGGTTRQPEQCYIPKQEVQKILNPTQCLIELELQTTSNTKSKTLFRHSAPINNMIYGFINADGKIELFLYDSSGNGKNLITDDIILEGENHLAFYWGNGIMGICANNTKKEVNTSNFPTNINDIINILSRTTTGSPDRQANTNIKSLVFSKPRSDEDIIRRQKFAEANGYYPIDDKVTAFLDLESGLRAYRRTTQ